MIKAVFFDLYHTLIEYAPPREETLAVALRRFGIKQTPANLRRSIIAGDEYFYQQAAQKSLSKRTETERHVFWATYQTIVLKEAGVEPKPELVSAILNDMNSTKYELILFDDVMPALTSLESRGIILGLVSNVDRDVSSLLDKLSIGSRLKIKLTSCEVGFTKPDPAIFLEAVRRSGMTGSETLYIGDQYQIDVLGARAAGLKALLLDRHDYFKEVPEAEKVHSLREIADCL
jgi:putative hydrolase of the HAD superfamily